MAAVLAAACFVFFLGGGGGREKEVEVEIEKRKADRLLLFLCGKSHAPCIFKSSYFHRRVEEINTLALEDSIYPKQARTLDD